MESLRFARCRKLACFAILLAMVGCKFVSAPVHVWVPPRLKSAVGQKIAIAPIAGDPKIAGPLMTKMISLAPRDAGRALRCTDARLLSPAAVTPTIRLVSAEEGETSDLANVAMARRQDADFLLTGEIVRRPSEVRSEQRKLAQGILKPVTPGDEFGIHEQLTVSWKLTDLREQTASDGFPVVTDLNTIKDPQEIAEAAAADAWKLITPHVIANSVTLATPRAGRGAAAVRRGNESATRGDWMSAQDDWNRVLRFHPRNHAAMHNLAIAAVARQDFEDAQSYIGDALRISGNSLYRMTSVWIESKQKDYHQAFGLNDPVEGWSAIRR